MRISKDEFNEKRSNDSEKAKVEEFLKTNKIFAFTSIDITAALLGFDISQNLSATESITVGFRLSTIEKVLKELIRENKVRKSMIQGKIGNYYIWK